MERLDLLERWRQEELRPFAGWDFSYIAGRIVSHEPPWSYADRAAELLGRSSSVLDMGTGGGERFLDLREYWPPNVTVTEEYPITASSSSNVSARWACASSTCT